MLPFITAAIAAILSVVEKLGYYGIFIGMAIESSFFPLPSELILIPAGALISQGKMNLWITLISSLLGTLFGALLSYLLALSLGRRAMEFLVSKYGKVFLISKDEMGRTDQYFSKHGEITTFIGRLLPGVRHLISLPAGFSKMNLERFCLFTALGATLWSSVLIYVGWLAAQHEAFIARHPLLITIFIVVIAVLLIAGYIWFARKRKKNKK